MKNQPLTVDAMVAHLAKFCAYRERSHAEVRQKLRELGWRDERAEEVMVELIRLDFLNEERFARAYVRGKYRMNGWGREKIRMGLQAEHVHERLIAQVMKAAVDEAEYLDILRKQAEKKARSLGGVGTMEQRQKLKTYLYGKGFEGDLIDAEIKRLKE
jgi:regulatory protein